MRMRFIGEYTNDRTTITYLECEFEGHDWRLVSPEVAALLAGHPEFEAQAVHPLDHDGDGEKGGSLPKKRGRPRKVAD